MSNKARLWLAKHLRDEPLAEEFAEYLSRMCVWRVEHFEFVPWEADIPKKEQWEEEVIKFNQGLLDL